MAERDSIILFSITFCEGQAHRQLPKLQEKAYVQWLAIQTGPARNRRGSRRKLVLRNVYILARRSLPPQPARHDAEVHGY